MDVSTVPATAPPGQAQGPVRQFQSSQLSCRWANHRFFTLATSHPPSVQCGGSAGQAVEVVAPGRKLNPRHIRPGWGAYHVKQCLQQ